MLKWHAFKNSQTRISGRKWIRDFAVDIFNSLLKMSSESDKMIAFCEDTYKDHVIRYKGQIVASCDNDAREILNTPGWLLSCDSIWHNKFNENKYVCTVVIKY